MEAKNQIDLSYKLLIGLHKLYKTSPDRDGINISKDRASRISYSVGFKAQKNKSSAHNTRTRIHNTVVKPQDSLPRCSGTSIHKLDWPWANREDFEVSPALNKSLDQKSPEVPLHSVYVIPHRLTYKCKANLMRWSGGINQDYHKHS